MLPKTIQKKYTEAGAKPIFAGYEIVGYTQDGQSYSSAYMPSVKIPQSINNLGYSSMYDKSDSSGGYSFLGSPGDDILSDSQKKSQEQTQVYQRRLVFENIPGTKIPIPIPRLKGEYVDTNKQLPQSDKPISRFAGEFVGRLTEDVLGSGPQQFYNVLAATSKQQKPAQEDIQKGLLYGTIGGVASVVAPVGYVLSGYSGYQAIRTVPTVIAEPTGQNFADLFLYSAGSIPVAKKLYKTGYDVYTTRGMTKLELAGYDTIPFLINDKQVFMRRYEGIKITKPSTWLESFKYKKGQFVKRQYRIISPEVQAYYEGKPTVSYYDFIDGEIKKVTKPTTAFPYDKPETFKEYFDAKGKELFGLPKTQELPANVEGKPFGYSATGMKWDTNIIGEAGQFYSGKGVSIGFLRLGNKYSGGIINLFTSDKPIVYASYGSKSVVVPKAFEVKAPNPYNPGGKPIKKYIFPGIEKEAGVFYIPTNKPEVQAVAFGKLVPIRKGYYFKLEGRRVPIQENIIYDEELPKMKELGEMFGLESSKSSILPSKSEPSAYSLLSLLSFTNKPSVTSYSGSSSTNLLSISKNISPGGSSSKPLSSFAPNIKSLTSQGSSINFGGGSSSPPNPPNQSRVPRQPPYPPTYPTSPPRGPPRVPPPKRQRQYKIPTPKVAENLVTAFRTYYLRKGKKEYLPGEFTRTEAIIKGEKKVLSGVAATFGIEKSRRMIRGVEYNYAPSERAFRSYQIKGGKQVTIKDRWIQKAGTKREPTLKGARLGRRSEVSELLSFRRSKIRPSF